MAFKTPKETLQAATSLGSAKASLPWGKLLVLSFLAGAYIALGGMLALVVGGAVPGLNATNPGVQKLLFGGVFPVGLMLVVIAGSELFTGNCAFLMPAVLSGKARWSGLARNWVGSFVGNFVGSLFVAYCLVYMTSILANEPWLSSVRGVAEAKVSQGFLPLILKGIGCNWLVCLAVWLAVAAEDVAGKILAIWWPIMAFVALGFEHSVANMFFVPLGIFHGAAVTWNQFLLVNLLPVTIGNIIGGAFFVGTIYWFVYGRESAS